MNSFTIAFFNDWVRNRFSVGGSHAFNKHLTLEMYVMRQNDGRSRPGRHQYHRHSVAGPSVKYGTHASSVLHAGKRAHQSQTLLRIHCRIVNHKRRLQ